jgi:hypothetical protein
MFVCVAAATGASADPNATNPPAVRPPTCAERYPADGPGGVDLQLGCIVSELMGAYTGTGEGSGAPPRVSAWLGPIAAGAAALAGLWLLLRTVRRRAARRMAPATPTARWSCPGCRSLNALGSAACYRCGRAWEEGFPEIPTMDESVAPQSFGRRFDR